MIPFEKFVYSILDALISSEVGLIIFLHGGFIVCAICTVLILTPLLRGMPLRLFVALGGAIPVVVAIYGTIFNLFVRGRQAGIMFALSPILFALIPTLVSLVFTFSNRSLARRACLIGMTVCLLLAQLWATLVIWLATNNGFMGASC